MHISFTTELNFRADTKGEHLIQIRCTQNRRHKRFSTSVSIPEKYWDKQKQAVKRSHPFATEHNQLIQDQLRKIHKAYTQLLGELDDDVTLEDLATRLTRGPSVSFFEFAESTKLASITAQKKLGTLRRYQAVLNKFKRFAGESLPIKNITYELLKKYEHFLVTELGNGRDTVSSNFSVIRSILNEAIKHGLYEKRNPFEQISLKYTDNTKQKLTLQELHRLAQVQLPVIPSLLLARDFFLACFYAGGSRGGDMVSLKRSNIKDGLLDYVQQKTGKRIVIPVAPQLLSIISHYQRTNSEYIFPLLKDGEVVNEIVINSRLTYVNKYLKTVCKLAGIQKKITTHCARHTFTDVALNFTNDNIYGVKEVLGHGSVKTTEIYTRQRVNQNTVGLLNQIYQSVGSLECNENQ